MDGDVDHLALILHAREPGQQNQVTRGGDRQELGDALDEGEQDQVEKRHAVAPVRDARHV